MVFAFIKFSEIRERFVASPSLGLPFIILVPSLVEQLVPKLRLNQKLLSFLQRRLKIQKCLVNESSQFSVPHKPLLSWFGRDPQRCLFRAEVLSRHRTVSCFASKGSADGESSYFQMSLSLAASFVMFSVTNKQ